MAWETRPFIFEKPMSNRKFVLRIIDLMLSDCMDSRKVYKDMRNMLFVYHSHREWALRELKAYIKLNKERDLLTVLEEFRYMLDCYSCNAKTEDSKFMFSAACDTVTNVLDDYACRKIAYEWRE